MALEPLNFEGLPEYYKRMIEREIEDEPRGLFIVIPRSIADDKKLTPIAKLLWGQIAALAHKGGYCYATTKFFAKSLGCSEIAIRRNLNLLKRRGLIKIEIERDSLGTRRRIWVKVCGKPVEKRGRGVSK